MLHFVKTEKELIDIPSNGEEVRSILWLCDAETPSDERIEKVFDWISQTSDEPPKYVCFAGANSEKAHDIYDEICISKNRDALTTWHNNEIAEDTAFFFNETVKRAYDADQLRVVLGVATTYYESKLLEVLKSEDY